ncbi:MAG: hypothetical protein JXA11_15250 [Phycisphaerae bacterium]|nr:hypothetical protein [Phycisphaerae bacterium]
MKKVLMVLGIVFLVLIAAVVALMVWAHGAGEERQEEFFQAAGTGDPQKLLSLCDPALADDLDVPVLKMWMDGLNRQLGPYKGLSKANFSTSSNTTNGRKFVESKGTALFEKGEAQVEMQSVNGKITAFRVTSEKLQPKDWFTKPPAEFYYQKGEKMITLLLTGKEADARAMMHPVALQKDYPLAQVQADAKKILAEIGPLQSVKLDQEEFIAGDSPKLIVRGTITGQKGVFSTMVKYQFVGMKGHITSWTAIPPQAGG